jgi:hypothetical protein
MPKEIKIINKIKISVFFISFSSPPLVKKRLEEALLNMIFPELVEG